MLALFGVVVLPVHAQSTPDDRLRNQLRETTLQLRQALDDNADLKAKLDLMSQQQPAAAPAPLPKAAVVDEHQTAALRHDLAVQAQQITALQQQIEADKQSLAQWQKGYQDAAELARTRSTEAKSLAAQYQDADGKANTCLKDNASLVQISDELLAHYKNKGLWKVITDAEPITGIPRIQLEKEIQEYHGRIVDATMPPPNPSTAVESEH
jgi:hypothetical protein